MIKQPRPSIADTDEFLKHEYEHAYNKVFKTYQDFELAMQQFVRQCNDCSTCYWLAGDKWCDCEKINTNDHDKENYLH